MGDGAPAASTITIDAMPYERTVTCPGAYPDGTAYVLTGTSTGSGAVTWAASPSGYSGSCTGTDTWSCDLKVFPSSPGDGVETITVTRGTATDDVTIGFYFEEAHTCFLAQSVNGAYNVGLSDLDAVATWENLGTSALDVTQGTGTAQPTFRTAIVGGQPVVRCDGGDVVIAAAASDWPFLNNGNDFTVETIAATSSSNPNALQALVATADGNLGTNRGVLHAYDDRAGSSRNDSLLTSMANGTTFQFATAAANGTVASAVFHGIQAVLDEGGGSEWNTYVDGTARVTVASVTGYSASDPQLPLSICQANSLWPLTGDLFRVLIYQFPLTATQRGINQAVDEWALGGTLPVTP
jgi:hypothetical protein